MSPSRKKREAGSSAGTFQCSPDVSFDALSLTSPSASYLAALAQVQEFRRLVTDELAAIAANVASTSAAPKLTNPLETPRKKLLSARVELARMDYMESPEIAALLFTSTHFGANEADAKRDFDAAQNMQEVTHVVALYEELRRNLVVRAQRRSKVAAIITVVVVLLYTAVSIPLICLSIALDPLNSLWTRLFDASPHFFPVDLVQKVYARGFLFICGIDVEWAGLEKVIYDQSTIGMFSHASNLDPVIVASGPLAWKWVGKKSLFRIPVIGQVFAGLHHIPIERENRAEAISSLARAAEIIREHRRCVAVSPEGTRSRTGRIQDFKKGAFHMAMQVGVPITPLLIEGAYELWPSGAIFAQPGTVTVAFLDPIMIAAEDTYVTLASKVRRSFLAALLQSAQTQVADFEAGRRATKLGRAYVDYTVHTMWLPVCYALLYLLYAAIRSVIGI